MTLTMKAAVIMQGSGLYKNRPGHGPGIFFDIFRSPVGRLFLIFSGNSLAGIRFEQEIEGLSSLPARGRAPAFFIKQISDYFRGSLREFRQEVIFLSGTDFEKKVWSCLRDIPYGETRTYKWVSERINRPGAFRAAGQALGKNPVPIVIPCHRVIASDGSLGGYSPDAGIKRRLIDIEYYFSRQQQSSCVKCMPR